MQTKTVLGAALADLLQTVCLPLRENKHHCAFCFTAIGTPDNINVNIYT